MRRFDVRASSFAGVFLALAAVAFLGPCSSDHEEVSGTGTIQAVQIEGGCWELTTDGEEYEVLNLEEDFPDFAEDGLQVRFEGTVRHDLATICQLGTNLEVTSLERVE